jgi:hypothetical protein
MTTSRYGATATLLRDGRVLIAGSGLTYPSETSLNSAELYDPVTGRFSATGSMAEARAHHTATLLSDGRVLVVGGENDEGAGVFLNSAELYDPASGRFSPTGAMSTPRENQSATLLRDGRVLVTGGDQGWAGGGGGGSGDMLATAEIYDPASGTFSPTGSMKVARSYHTASLLPNGKVLILGGWDHDLLALGSAEMYDPQSNRFDSAGSMTTARGNHTATLLSDGRVLVTGGSDYYAGADSMGSAEIYDPTTAKFGRTASMTVKRAFHTATLLTDGRVLIAGSSTGNPDAARSAELYDPATGTFRATGSMAVDRTEHTATLLLDGRVLIAGSAYSAAAGAAELYWP